MTPIRIEGITKSFGRTVALEDVSLAIDPGEIFFLLGPSGCGKTTLLRVLAGLEAPDSGRILFGERDVTDLPPRRREAVMVFQSYALWPHMSVERNVGFGLEVRGKGRRERDEAVREALEKVRLLTLADRRPGQLSGGQQQRVALARALVVRPGVLLLDEPLSNLDAGLRSEMRSEIRRLCKETGLTALYVTHDQHEAMAVADRIALIREGRVVQVDTPRGLYARPRSRFAAEFMGVTNLLEARVVEAGPPAVLETPVGRLEAGELPGSVGEGEEVACSVRPEAWSLGAGPVRGRIEESVFMGERAEHLVRTERGGPLLVYEPAPREGGRETGERVELAVEPGDVVVLGGEGGG